VSKALAGIKGVMMAANGSNTSAMLEVEHGRENNK